MSSNGTTGCQDPKATTQTWVLLGVFLALAFFSRLLTYFLFQGLSGALRSIGATSLDRSLRNLFMIPTALLLMLLFLHLAWQVAPWLCALGWLRNVIGFLILCAALLVVLILVARLFDFAEIFIRYFSLNKVHATALREGIRVAKLTALFFVGLLFFSIIVRRLDPSSEFRLNLFFSGTNIISLGYIIFFIPVTRDALGGVLLIVDNSFRLGDWIEVDGIKGTVERIGLFVVVVRTLKGRMTMIENSRFVESNLIIYPFDRRRVVVLRFPLPENLRASGENDASIRNLLVQVEASLRDEFQTLPADLKEHTTKFHDVFVDIVSSDVGMQLEVRYVSDDLKSVEAQAEKMNEVIMLIAQRKGISIIEPRLNKNDEEEELPHRGWRFSFPFPPPSVRLSISDDSPS